MSKKAIIIGAGPAGLTAAYELLKRTDIKPIILEKSGDIGGISKTVNYKGNRIDIGGHRFFSKSDRVMNWWLNILPLQDSHKESFAIRYQNKTRAISPTEGTASGDTDKVMLVRKRLSRIYFLRKFFTYPIQLSIDTLRKLGLLRTITILFSYLKAQLFPRKPEKSLEDFMINRFGNTLYELFFKDYTEKVWGVPCHEIPAEWGAQRIKGVSITKAIQHAVKAAVKKKKQGNDIAQKDTETSLIEQFLYPKLGPGQLWEEVTEQIKQMGGKIVMFQQVKEIHVEGTRSKEQERQEKQVASVTTINTLTGEETVHEGDYFFSTMPVKELIAGMGKQVPADVQEIAAGLPYRDFITVGILLKRLSYQDKTTSERKPLSLNDTWIYIQEKEVTVGRLQIFNNWSPYMVKDPDTVWIGMEFFCNTTDAFWNLPDIEIQRIAIEELEKIGLASTANVLDATVLRMEKTYPAYFGTYNQFDKIRAYTDSISNLFLVGRNGMHKYNNSDHSMLTAMVAVDNIISGVTDKANIWSINTEQEYHEEKHESGSQKPEVGSTKNQEKEGHETSNGQSRQNRSGSKRKDEELILENADLSVGVLEYRETSNTELKDTLTFKDFLFRIRRNRTYLTLSAIAIIIQFAVFKYFYPFASFINGDSYTYLETAYHNLSINIYPVGYSNFLRLFSVFTKSDTILVSFQYLILQASLLGLLFTLFYFYRPGKAVQIILLAFMVLNPVFLYLANYVSSDSLFLTLSLVWFTLLLWILYRPSTKLIIWHGLVLFLAFTVRYNALFYPLIAGLAFFLSKQRVLTKIAGTSLGVILIGLFVWHTSSKYYTLSGVRQFSPFTGWQMANNAMYAYRYVDSADVKPVPEKFQALDKAVRTYFDTTRDVKKHPQEMLVASTVYMWDPRSPLQHYMNAQFTKDTATGELKRWATVAPLYADYGSYLIRQYPLTYAKYYLWPNFLKYYAPPVEFLEQYSTGKDSVSIIAKAWFGYKSTKIKSRFKDFKVSVLDFYPILVGTLNVVFLCGILGFIFLQGYKQHPLLKQSLLLVAGFWLVNFGFSTFASPIALRFQLFPIFVFLSFAALFMEYIVKAAMSAEIKVPLSNETTSNIRPEPGIGRLT